MKIVHIISHQSPFDSERLVGVKKMVNTLAQGQIKKGYEVVIIATKNSKSENLQIFETISPLSELGISVYDSRSFIYGIAHGEMAADYINSNNFDVVHSHAEQNFLPFIKGLKTPVISTIHGTDFSQDIKYLYKTFYGKFNAVALSQQAIKANDFIKYDDVVYNAIDINSFEFSEGGEDMFWLGRINPKKGVLEAAQAASKTGKKIQLMGYVEAGQEEYLDKLNGSLDSAYVSLTEGFLDKPELMSLMSKSKLFLNPILWEEPFGLVMIESMASGTPVVAFARGSVPEIIKDGETGLIVNPSDTDIRGDFIIKKTGMDGICEAIEKIYSLDHAEYSKMRELSREHVKENFSVDKMVENYERVYNSVLSA